MFFVELSLENFGPFRGRQNIQLAPDSLTFQQEHVHVGMNANQMRDKLSDLGQIGSTYKNFSGKSPVQSKDPLDLRIAEAYLTPDRTKQRYPEAIDRPIVLLGGMNGAGKTSILEGIRLALYGKRSQPFTKATYRDYLLQYRHYDATDTDRTSVELEFTALRYGQHRYGRWGEHNQMIQQVDAYRVCRSWDQKGVEQLAVYVNDAISTSAMETWDQTIEQVLPLGVSSLYLFDGEQVAAIAEQEKPPASLVSAIKELCGITIFEQTVRDLEVLHKRKLKELANDLQVEATLNGIEVAIGETRAKLAEATAAVVGAEAALSDTESALRTANEVFLTKGGKIAAERHAWELNRQNLLEQKTAQEKQLRELAAGNLPLLIMQPLLAQAHAQGEAEQAAARTHIAQELLHDQQLALIDAAPSLGLEAELLQKVEMFLEAHRQAIIAEANTLEPWLLASDHQVAALNNLLQSLPALAATLESEISAWQTVQAALESVETILDADASDDEYQRLITKVSQAQDQVAQRKVDMEAALSVQRKHEREHADVRQRLVDFGETLIDSNDAQNVLNASQRAIDTMAIFLKRVTDQRCVKLEAAVTECLLFLTHKGLFFKQVKIDRRDFSLSIVDHRNQVIPKSRLSAGEKQVLATSYLWGLGKIGGISIPIVIDTPMGRLDSSHRQHLLSNYFPHASQQVILLSTDTEIGAKEFETLQRAGAISHSYLLQYRDVERRTVALKGQYFFDAPSPAPDSQPLTPDSPLPTPHSPLPTSDSQPLTPDPQPLTPHSKEEAIAPTHFGLLSLRMQQVGALPPDASPQVTPQPKLCATGCGTGGDPC